MNPQSETSDLLVFSHHRWDNDFHRPHQLFSRHAKNRRVFYFEEPVFGMTTTPQIYLKESREHVQVVVPHLPAGLSPGLIESAMKSLVDELVSEVDLKDLTVWYSSPSAFSFSEHLATNTVVFDCTDDVSAQTEHPQWHMDQEALLMKKADVVFTGSKSLYENKKFKHSNIHPFPSSGIDTEVDWDLTFSKMLTHEIVVRSNKMSRIDKDYQLPIYMDSSLSAIGIV